MKSYSFAVLSALVAGALAQDDAASSTSSAPAPASTFIPSNISPGCKGYLEELDSSDDIATCLSSLVTATAEFNPTTSNDYSDDALANTLKTLCTSGCDETKIRTHLASFYTACQDDLLGDGANDRVKQTYDILYVLTPLRQAVCAKNTDTGKYCVQEIHVDNSTASPNPVGKALIATGPTTPQGLHVTPETLELLATNLYEKIELDNSDFHLGVVKRADNDTLALMPDTNTWRLTSLIYLFISPTYTNEQLCTSCTKEVLESYVRFEAATPYAMGITHSPLLGDQLDLWTNVTSKCGNDYAQTIMSNAGVTSNTDNSGNNGVVGAASRTSVAATVVVALVAGVVGVLAL